MNRSLLGLLLLSAVLVRQFTWSLVNPMFQAPDEVQHLFMVSLLDKYGLGFYAVEQPVTWRSLGDAADIHEDHFQQRGIIWRENLTPRYLEGSRWGIDEQEKLHAVRADAGEHPDTSPHNAYTYPPLYYWLIALVLRPLRWAGLSVVGYLFGARLLGAAFFAGTLYWVHKTAREFMGPAFAALATALVFLHPMLTFLPSAVNNDNGLLLTQAVTTFCVARFLKGGGDRKTLGLLMLATCAGVAMKSHAVVFAGVATAIAAGGLWLARRRREALEVAGNLAIAAGSYLATLATIGPPKLQGQPDPVGLLTFLAKIREIFAWRMLMNLVGQFAWFEVTFPPLLYWAFAGVFVAAGVSWLSAVRRVARSGLAAADGPARVVAGLGALAVAFPLAMLGLQFLMMPKVGFFFQGRYVLWIVPLAYLVLAAQLERWSLLGSPARRKLGLASIAAGVPALALTNLYGLYLVVERFFWKPGVTGAQLFERLVQYKPAFLKAPPVLAALVLATVALQAWVAVRAARGAIAVARHPAPPGAA